MPDNDGRLDGLIAELAGLTTERSSVERGDLDRFSTAELVRLMNREDQRVALAVSERSEDITAAVDAITDRFRRGGRLIYIGAGTAGRIGVLDASECPPTFGTPPSMVLGIIAGGSQAILSAVENAEDDDAAGAGDLRAISLTPDDAVVGISASGRTPYVAGALTYARRTGALTIALSSNEGSVIGALADIAIEVAVGPEFITGSTRLKSGSAQKLVANMLTTLSMIRLGKTYNGVMVDLQATNEKLHARSIRTIMELAEVSSDVARSALSIAQGSVKRALLMLLAGVDDVAAVEALEASAGSLPRAIRRCAGEKASGR